MEQTPESPQPPIPELGPDRSFDNLHPPLVRILPPALQHRSNRVNGSPKALETFFGADISHKMIDDSPVAKYGQDLLDFPDAIPEIRKLLIDEFMEKNQSPSATPEEIISKVKREVSATFIGVTATVVYADMAEQLVPHIEQQRPLATEQIPRFPLHTLNAVDVRPPRYVGTADDFARTALAWLLGASIRVHKQAEDPNSYYHPLIQATIESSRDRYGYAARNLAAGNTSEQDFLRIQGKLECNARNAATNFSFVVLSDNVRVALEMLLHFGLARSREEQAFPEGDELTATALAYATMMSRASTIGATNFQPMVHSNPLATTFQHYELTHLPDVSDLYPSRENIFTRVDNSYTFRFPPIMHGPKKAGRKCPAPKLWRPPHANYQDAIERLFACAEKHGDCKISRPGDGSYRTADALPIFGSFVAKETIYNAWPKGDEIS